MQIEGTKFVWKHLCKLSIPIATLHNRVAWEVIFVQLWHVKFANNQHRLLQLESFMALREQFHSIIYHSDIRHFIIVDAMVVWLQNWGSEDKETSLIQFGRTTNRYLWIGPKQLCYSDLDAAIKDIDGFKLLKDWSYSVQNWICQPVYTNMLLRRIICSHQ